MLTKIEIELEKQGQELLNLNTGAVMHGALMEFISPEYAEYLHENTLHPFSQYIHRDREKDCYVWQIAALNKTAKEQIIDKLQDIETVDLKYRNTKLKVRSVKKYKSVTYKELADEYMLKSEAVKKFVIKFVTPATFKVSGSYVNFPYIQNIYSNLITKWNNFSEEISLSDSDTQTHLVKYSEMWGYKLRSTKYTVETNKINSFMGEMCIRIKGPLTMVSVANMLFEYAKYAGIGAKTCMGMGGVKIE